MVQETLAHVQAAVERRLITKYGEPEGQTFPEKKYFYDKYGLYPVFHALNLIEIFAKPGELKKWMTIVSATNWGESIFREVYPAFDNPHDFHSDEAYVYITDKPVQVLGWQDVEDRIAQGVAVLRYRGMKDETIQRFIERGFYQAFENHGLDPEWHFMSQPPQGANPLQLSP